MPAEGGVAALRRRVFRKTSNFDVGRRGHLRGVAEPVAPAPPALPVAGADAGHAAGAAADAVACLVTRGVQDKMPDARPAYKTK